MQNAINPSCSNLSIWGMNTWKYFYAQPVLPKRVFDGIAIKYYGNKYVIRIKGWTLLKIMLIISKISIKQYSYIIRYLHLRRNLPQLNSNLWFLLIRKLNLLKYTFMCAITMITNGNIFVNVLVTIINLNFQTRRR